MNNTKLRIAVWHNLPSGGGKRALHDHVRGLTRRGHHVEVWCPSTADLAYLSLSDVADEHVLPINLPPPRPVRLLKRLRIRDDTKWRLRAIEDHSRAAGKAIGARFDVVLAATCQFTAVPAIGAHLSVPSVLYLQEPNRWLYEALPKLPWLGRRSEARRAVVQGQAELAHIQTYSRVLVNSHFSREGLLRAFGVDSHVCYLGVDTQRFRPVTHAARDYVVGLGAFTPLKNIELILRALGRISPDPPPLTWIGNHTHSNTYVAELQQLAGELGVPFTPKVAVSDAELIATLAGARLSVYSPRLEPFGFAPLEANACGVPVVGSAEGGVRETVIDGLNGLLVEPGVGSLSAGIAELWDDRDRAAALGAAARQHVAGEWTIEAAVDRLETQLFEVLR